MNADLHLFPVWTKWDGCIVGEVWRRVLRQGDGSRQLVGFLSLLNGHAKFSARWEEHGVFVMDLIGPFQCEGVSSLSRAVTWAEWLIFDMGGEQRKRAPRRKRQPAEEVAA